MENLFKAHVSSVLDVTRVSEAVVLTSVVIALLETEYFMIEPLTENSAVVQKSESGVLSHDARRGELELAK